MSTIREMRDDFQQVITAMRFGDYKKAVSRYTMDHYGFNADQAYPKTTERIALACFEAEDEPAIPAELIAEHHNAPKLLTID